MSSRELTVLLGHFDPPWQARLRAALSGESGLRVLPRSLPTTGFSSHSGGHWAQLVVLDERAGHAALMRLKAVQPGPKMVVVAREPADLYGALLLAAGVTCLAQGTSAADVIAAVRHAARGEHIFIAADGRRIASRDQSRVSRLTPRQRQVFERLSNGQTDGAIALALGISPETVRKHTAQIRRKLEVRSKREILDWA